MLYKVTNIFDINQVVTAIVCRSFQTILCHFLVVYFTKMCAIRLSGRCVARLGLIR